MGAEPDLSFDGSCSWGYVATPCDEVAICNETHFDTEAEYQACVDAAQADITACNDACVSGDDPAADRTACITTCTDAFAVANDACATAQTECQDPCNSAYESCFTGCAGDHDCENACQDTLGECTVACNIAASDCTSAAEGVLYYCEFDCETTYEMAVINAAQAFAVCSRNCCSGADEHPAPCARDCADDLQTCVGSVTSALRACSRACGVPTDAGWSDCQYACHETYDPALNDCSSVKQLCDWECTIVDEQNVGACGWYESYCNWKCEETYQPLKRACDDTKIVAFQVCLRTAADCTDDPATCANAETACIDALNEAYKDCLDGPNTDRFDCRQTCCRDTYGGDADAACFQTCFHDAGCDRSPTDCAADLRTCLESCPGVYVFSDDPATPKVLQYPTCSPCIAYGQQAFSP